jgi:hypothetical protein
MNKPIHDSDEMCPLMNKKRKLVCHKCAFYMHIRGKHPQSDADMDNWDCAVVFMPVLMIENVRHLNANHAAITSLREEVVDGNNRRITADVMRTTALIQASQRK